VRTLPTMMVRVLIPFAPLFSKRVWQHVQVLLAGAFPQLRAEEPSVPLCARWVWTTRSSSIPTTGCSEKR
jgi:hypothetical protein